MNEPQSDTPKTDELDRINYSTSQARRLCMIEHARTLERKLNEAIKERDDWKNSGIYIAAVLVSAGCKSDGIRDGVDEIVRQLTASRELNRKLIEELVSIKPPAECPWCTEQDFEERRMKYVLSKM